MPELPEVETIRGYLRAGKEYQPPVLGRQIKSAEALWVRSIAYPSPVEFEQKIAGQVISEIGRRGKYLIFFLSADQVLLHLRMSGDLSVRPAGQPPEPHDRVLFHLEGEITLVFNDPRKFGRVWLVSDSTELLGSLGPEPFDSELTEEIFYQRLLAHHRQLKPLLMDQGFLAGMGNIYTDEALHLAHLHPLARADRLSSGQSAALLRSIRLALEGGLRSHGASIDWVYRGGEFQNYFRAYGRTGQPCPDCSTPIARIIVGQRSTHYCPTCQVLDIRVL